MRSTRRPAPPAHVLERAAREPDRTIRYAPRPTGVIDVFAPPAATASTLVVLVHGGFWRARYDRTHLRPLAEALAAHGLLVAVPEYRRVGDEGGGWPAILTDVVEAIRAAAELAPGCRVVVVGHSAGGHLAVLAVREVPGIDHVVSLAGVLDLTDALRTGLSNDAVRDLLGAGSGEAELALADPMRLSVPACRVTVIHGASDDHVPVAYSRRYAERDPRIRSTVLDGADHYDVIDPLSPVYRVLVAAVEG